VSNVVQRRDQGGLDAVGANGEQVGLVRSTADLATLSDEGWAKVVESMESLHFRCT